MPSNSPSMIILIGIQGSGKTTFYNRYLWDYVHINLDSLHTRRREEELIGRCIAEHLPFAVDNTNPTKADRARYISAAQEHGYTVTGYFMESKLQPCIERNNLRTGKARIPPQAIAATSNKLELPGYTEGFDRLFFVSTNGSGFLISDWREIE